MPAPLKVDVRDPSAVGAARRGSVEFALSAGLSEARTSDLAIVVTELARNLVKHTPQGGEVLISAAVDGALEVLVLDSGPGLRDPAAVMRDGYSTSGTPGTGLGAVSRLASAFDLYSLPGQGCVVLARFQGPATGTATFEVGGVQVPHPREHLSGDGWAAQVSGPVARLLMVDGLGHGLHAHEAAQGAIQAFRQAPHLPPLALMQEVHGALRGTRGAVGAVAELDHTSLNLRFSGIGNIMGAVVESNGRRGLVSLNGTLGQEVRKFTEQTTRWGPQSTLILHTDGLSSSWDLSRYPGLLRRPAALIAGVLYRDFQRGRDDATILVVKAPQ
jgi:anti-sigma regulatory factor (Ser/Thr protein kinase)